MSVNYIWPQGEVLCPGCDDLAPELSEETGLCSTCERYGPEVTEAEEARYFLERYGHRRTNERPH